jgi:integrase
MIRSPRNRVPSPKTWTPEELGVFLESVRGERLYAAWVLCATTGMRRGELLGLSWSEVDLTQSRIQIVKALVCVRYEPRVSDPKTARGRRAIELDPQTASVLAAHREAMRQEGQERQRVPISSSAGPRLPAQPRMPCTFPSRPTSKTTSRAPRICYAAPWAETQLAAGRSSRIESLLLTPCIMFVLNRSGANARSRC